MSKEEEKDMKPIIDTIDKALKQLIELHSHYVVDENRNKLQMVEVSDLELLIDEYAKQQPEVEFRYGDIAWLDGKDRGTIIHFSKINAKIVLDDYDYSDNPAYEYHNVKPERLKKQPEQGEVETDYQLREQFCSMVEEMDGKPTADNVRGSMTQRWAIEFFKRKQSTLTQDKVVKRLERSDQFLRTFARSGLLDNEATENLWKCIKLNEEVLNSKKH